MQTVHAPVVTPGGKQRGTITLVLTYRASVRVGPPSSSSSGLLCTPLHTAHMHQSPCHAGQVDRCVVSFRSCVSLISQLAHARDSRFSTH
jgi:hypothetical protein